MITPVDVKLAEELGFTRGSPEHTTKAALIAQFRERVIVRELSAMGKELSPMNHRVVLAPHIPVNAQQDADVKTWSLYAAAQLIGDALSVVESAKIADQMLVEQKKRSPSSS